MATLLGDDGTTQTFLTDDGRTVTVARPFGEGFAPTPEAGGLRSELQGAEEADQFEAQQGILPPELAPDPGALAPSPDLLPPGPAAPIAPSGPDAPIAQPGPAEPPPAAPQPAPLAPAAPPPVAAEPAAAPAVVPEGLPKNATQAAALGIQGLQTQADATQRGAEAQAAGSEALVGAYDEAEQRLAQEQQLREQYQRARAREEQQLLAEKRSMVDRYKNWRVDRRRLFREMSTGDTVLAAVSMALGSLGAAFTKADDPNAALGVILKQLDQDVQLQLAERDQLGAAIGMKNEEIADFQRVSSSRVGEYNTRMAAHLARLERDVAKIAAKTQSATVKANADAFIGQLQQKGAEMLQAGVTADRAFNEQVRARRAQIGMQRQNLVADMKAKGFVPDGRGGWAIDPERPGPSAKDVETLRYLTARADKTEAEAKLVKQAATAGPGGTPGAIGDPNQGGAPILNKDGKPWVPSTEKEQQIFRDVIPATQNVRRIADKLALAIEKHGGSSALVGSPEYQEVYALARQMDMEQKDIWGLGVVQGRDIELLEAIRGGKDPTSFIYDAGPAIKALADRLEERTTTRMRAQGFTGDWKPARLAEAEARELTPAENEARLTSPLSTGAGQDSPAGKALRTKEIEQKKAAVPALLRTKPTVEQLSTWGQKIEEQRAAGAITAEEAIAVMNQTAPRVLQEWRSKIQKMDTAALLKAQQDPEFFRRATILGLLDSGAARPEEIYRLVIGR